MNRAANSICLNIAEGAAKTDRQFTVYLETSVGSIWEVVAASFLALDQKYITEQEQLELYNEGEHLAKSINAFRNILQNKVRLSP